MFDEISSRDEGHLCTLHCTVKQEPIPHLRHLVVCEQQLAMVLLITCHSELRQPDGVTLRGTSLHTLQQQSLRTQPEPAPRHPQPKTSVATHFCQVAAYVTICSSLSASAVAHTHTRSGCDGRKAGI